MQRVALLGLLLVSCGKATDVHTRSGPTEFTGSSAWVYSGPSPGVPDSVDGGQTFNLFQLLISDVLLPCNSANLPPSFAAVNVGISTQAPEQVGPGTYVFDGAEPSWLWVYYVVSQGQSEPTAIGVSSGRLDLRRLDDSVAEGSVDLTLLDTTHIAGAFSAQRCP